DALNIDPMNFYSQLYRILMRLHAGAPNDDIIIVLRCLDAMLTRRRKQVTLQRAMAFLKRLSTLSMHVMPNASVGILAANRATMHSFPKCDFLLDNEIQGSGFYLPELDEPEHCSAQNTALWELHTLQRHFHPVVRRFAGHLSHGAPSDGSSALSVELCRRSPLELFEDYSVKDMTFNPPVAPPASKKKVGKILLIFSHVFILIVMFMLCVGVCVHPHAALHFLLFRISLWSERHCWTTSCRNNWIAS
ncbi:Nucleolar complex protein 3, partial [Ataeniobius toweri]|nr:Nucleolar complex protein 3 [Ataeniobius toweri]